MRMLVLVVLLTLIGCAVPTNLENARNSTVPARDGPERKCDRPQTVFPREALSMIGSKPVRTTLRFELLATGRVGATSVKTSSGYKVLDDAAATAVGKMKCAPLTTLDKSVWLETWYDFKVE